MHAPTLPRVRRLLGRLLAARERVFRPRKEGEVQFLAALVEGCQQLLLEQLRTLVLGECGVVGPAHACQDPEKFRAVGLLLCSRLIVEQELHDGPGVSVIRTGELLVGTQQQRVDALAGVELCPKKTLS